MLTLGKIKRMEDLFKTLANITNPYIAVESRRLFCYHEGKYTLKPDGTCCKCHLKPNPKKHKINELKSKL